VKPASLILLCVALALVVWSLIPSFLVLLVSGPEGGKPMVGESRAYPSPDGAYTATLEVVDNGLGFGQGALYDEVHVTRLGEPVGAHGDPGRSVVFYAQSTYRTDGGVKLTWLGNRHLRVEYEREQRPGRAVRTLDGIVIEILSAKS